MISSTPLMPLTAASTRCVTWDSSSVGAAPGWATEIVTKGKLRSGFWLTSIRRKLTIPAISNIANRTRGVTGFLIAHADMFLKFIQMPREFSPI